jgi:hypothetical protein
MSTIVTRAGKGSALTHNEVDANFVNLNTDKLQSGNTAAALTITSATINGGTITGTALNGTLGATTPSTVAATTVLVNLTSNFNSAKIQAKDTGTGCYGWTDSTSVVDARLFAATGQGAVLATQSAHPISLQTNAIERMRIDSAGNVGIGITPSAWGTSTKALEFGGTINNYLAFNNSGISGAYLYWNMIYDGTNNKYKSTGVANAYGVDSAGQHLWFNAPSGTAGTTTTLTQAMTLVRGGALLVGYTSGNNVTNIETSSISIGQTGTSSTTAKIRFAPAQSGYNVMGIYNSQSASGGGLVFTTDDSSTNSSNTKLMTLNANGSLNFNVAGADINTKPTSLPSSTSIGYSIITSLGEITFVENVTNVTLSSVSLPPGVWQITFVAQLIDAFGVLNATACACAITTDSAYAFPIATNANFRPDHNVMYTTGIAINLSSYRGRVMHTRTVTNTTGSNVTYYIRIGTNGTGSGTYGLKGELNAIKVY